MVKHHHGRNLRKGRCSFRGGVYLVTTVTHNRAPLFTDIYLGRVVVTTLMRESRRAATLACVVMPDHLHWLMRLVSNDSLSSVVQAIKSVSSHRMNTRMARKGKIWQSRYHDHGVRHEEDLPGLARYVVGNPLRANLVNSIGEYPLWDAVWL